MHTLNGIMSPDTVVNETNATQRDCNANYYGIAPITLLTAEGQELPTFAMLDSGSGVTLINASLFDKLGLTGKAVSMRLRWTNSETELRGHKDKAQRACTAEGETARAGLRAHDQRSRTTNSNAARGGLR